jgi:CheY-like chemotaxis protein
MSCKVLVVDDDMDLREVLCELLSSLGRTPVPARDGKEALATLRSDPQAFCVVLLDLMMPGIDGWQFRREQLADAAIAHVPVVMMTAGRVAAGGQIGGAAILYKPVSSQTLIDAIAPHCPSSPRAATSPP